MTASQLISEVTSALFVLLFIALAVSAARSRRREEFDAALLFATLALAVIPSQIAMALGVQLDPLVQNAMVAPVLAFPYLTLRLVEDFSEVPRPVIALAIAGLVLSVVGLFALPLPRPPAYALGVAVYFLGIQSYAAAAFVREARRSPGPTGYRMWAAAGGSLLLALAILAAGVRPATPTISDLLLRGLALGSAIAYVVAFAPPAFLRRAWREPHLRAFLAQATAISPAADAPVMVAELERAAADAMGAAGGAIGLWDEEARVLRFGSGTELRPGEAVAGRAFAERRAVFSGDARRDHPEHAKRFEQMGARAVLAAPMIARGRSVGALSVYARRGPIFTEDDLALVQVLADEAAIVMDGGRLYAELRRANDELAAATRAKSEFLASMSHELRTPLNAVLGFTELLREQLDSTLTDRQRRYLGNIRDAGEHLLALVNDVLDLSKVEANRIELRPEPLSLRSLLEPVVATTREAAASKGIAFEVLDGTGVIVRLDAARVRQVLYNLLSNAVKFTGDGGGVRLTARADGKALTIEVSDTGIGIPADKRDRVFGVFERLHEGRSDAPGTGLGLALTKRLVELHGGTIDFESEEGRGTTFRVRFAGAIAEPVSGDRLLVVDDTPADAELIAALATKVGLRTEVVGTAEAAIDAIRRDPPRAVALDLRLPDERGERVLEALKADPATRNIPVLVVTIEDDEGRSRPLGADGHLTKPIDHERLSQWLRRVAAEPDRKATA